MRGDGEPVLTERLLRQIERLLDAADEAAARNDWATVHERAEAVLRIVPGQPDALTYLAAASRGPDLAAAAAPARTGEYSPDEGPSAGFDPTSFCDGRYRVVRFLGGGGKKRVFHAHDTKLDRDIAFALIKTEGLDAEGTARTRRKAQAMGRLGDHPHIVPVYDIA